MRFAGTNINNFLNRRDQYSGTAKSGIAAKGPEQEAGISAATNVGKGLMNADAAVQMAREDGKTMMAQADAQGRASMASAGAQAAGSLLSPMLSGGFGGSGGSSSPVNSSNAYGFGASLAQGFF